MKNIQMKLLLFIIVITSIFIAGYTNSQNNSMPDDFNFSLNYGINGKQKIDTFNNVVVKDLVEDGTKEANILLTKREKQIIYDEMIKLDIMGELNLEEEKECETQPSSLSKWNIHMNGETKSFNYTTFCEIPDDALNLIRLEDFIHSIISNKEEYKELPDANGAYM
ncbi:hypothetical protein FS935_08615 [Metabacillus litoralis]|uniref:Uncharacterized protein n=1 Tax=Metabacillus litoralis TaxID=152268 RepID=A0A5C6VZC8_9BACI|nr:hypothetical protein [Metabacillus litoralis]TXC90959.1 hypothetical protein FS935_08615 [Metabacillus litoralis]